MDFSIVRLMRTYMPEPQQDELRDYKNTIEKLLSFTENLSVKETTQSIATDSTDQSVKTRIANLIKKDNIRKLHQKLSHNSIDSYANLYKRRKISSLNDSRFHDNYERIKAELQQKYFKQDLKTFYKNVVRYKHYFDHTHMEAKRMFAPCLQQILERSSTLHQKQDKEVETAEKERLLCLKEGNEVKYREMINKLKNKRLATILETTDEHLFNMMQMVKRHKHSQITGRPAESYTELSKRKYELLLSGEYVNLEEGSEVGEQRVTVKKLTDNSTLKGNHAPKLKNLHQWLLKNPDWTWDADDAVWDEIDEYDQDFDKNATHEESYYSMAHKIKEKITTQPSILVNGSLKPYQLKGLEWLVSLHNNKLNGILADEMGLGKTIQTIALITYMMESKSLLGPYLIIVPLSTLSNWQMEFNNWAPSVKVLSYKGNVLNRREVQNDMRLNNFNVLLTTYEYIIKDKAALAKFPWIYVIVDEGHRIKNQECRLTQVLNTYYYRSAARLLLTGTPLQNKLTELWALLNFLLPDIFKSLSAFEEWFSAPFAAADESAALNEEETILIIRRLHKVLRPFLLRRLKKEVEHQLPQKVEHVIKCEMSGLQRVLYKHMQSKGVLLTDGSEQGRGGRGGVKALMNTIVQLRKICNHPFIYDHIENNYAKHKGEEVTGVDLYRVAGKFELLDRMLPKLQASNHRVLLFCQMTQCLNILEDYLTFRQVQYLRLDGSTKAEDRAELLTQFNDTKSPYFLFLLSTRAGGLGLNLQTADTVIIFDSDWNPHQDLQAQDRAHRIGQRNEVRVFRLITANSVEERILAAARFKLSMDEKVIQAGMFNQKSTDVERRKFLQSILQQTDNEEQELSILDNEELNLILARNEEEISLFKQLDETQKHSDKKELGKRKRLISESELPKWLTDNEQASQPDLSEELQELGRTRLSTRLAMGNSVEQQVNMKEADSDIDSEESEEEDTDKGLKQLMQNIMQDVIDFHDDQGRYLSEMFLKLPTKRQLPNYYAVIERPIDIKQINRRISLNVYKSVDELQQDFMLMCTNAQTYNEPGSQIYADSIALETIFGNIRKQVTKSSAVEASNVRLKRKQRTM